MPRCVFTQVASDVVQIAGLGIALGAAFLAGLAMIDYEFGLPRTPEIDARLGNRKHRDVADVIYFIRAAFALMLMTLFAKACCLWFTGHELLPALIDHLSAFFVGILLAIAVLSSQRVFGVAKYLATASTWSLGALAMLRGKAVGQQPDD